MMRNRNTNRIFSLTALLLAAVILCLCGSVDAQSVRIKARLTTDAGDIRLDDIAWCGDLPAAAKNIVLAKVSENNPAACLNISHVEKALRDCGVNPARVKFSGSAACLITLRQQPDGPQLPQLDNHREISANLDSGIATIGDYIKAQAAMAMNMDAEKVKIIFSRGSALMAKDSLDAVSQIDCEKSEITKGECRWRIVFDRDGRSIQRWLTGSVCVIKKGVVTTGPLKAGQSITAADICIGDVDDDGTFDYYEKPSEVVGLKLRGSLSTGQAIELDNVDSPVLVRTGRSVTVSCGMVNITAKARDCGKMGEVIRVENIRSGHMFSAVVTGPSSAKVAGDSKAGGQL